MNMCTYSHIRHNTFYGIRIKCVQFAVYLSAGHTEENEFNAVNTSWNIINNFSGDVNICLYKINNTFFSGSKLRNIESGRGTERETELSECVILALRLFSGLNTLLQRWQIGVCVSVCMC